MDNTMSNILSNEMRKSEFTLLVNELIEVGFPPKRYSRHY